MILDKTGELFSFNGVRYAIGDTVMATKSSDYAGLFGTITEIRTGADLETENDDVDIYCEFYPPVAPYDVQEFEKNMSRLYQTEKKLEDITLDLVIMAPEMISPLNECDPLITIFEVTVDWACDEERGVLRELFTDYASAKYYFETVLFEELSDGDVPDWRQNAQFCERSFPYQYDAYIDDDYGDHHYQVEISPTTLHVGRSFTDKT